MYENAVTNTCESQQRFQRALSWIVCLLLLKSSCSQLSTPTAYFGLALVLILSCC